jgi:chitinase
MGATVMIGQNDTPGELFAVSDAQKLTAFAEQVHLGRVSMWSLNRDSQCGTAYAEVGKLSNTCSGTTQSGGEFTKTFGQLTGSAQSQAGQVTPSAPPVVADNPATSPYPIWQPGGAYVAGYKVVRQGNVYQAKWYTQGDDPAAQVQYAYQSPWQLIGPVLPTDRAPTTTTLPPDTYPTWSPTVAYPAGSKVLLDGLPYQAKWYNQSSSPAASALDPSSSPWSPLFTVPGEPPTS